MQHDAAATVQHPNDVHVSDVHYEAVFARWFDLGLLVIVVIEILTCVQLALAGRLPAALAAVFVLPLVWGAARAFSTASQVDIVDGEFSYCSPLRGGTLPLNELRGVTRQFGRTWLIAREGRPALRVYGGRGFPAVVAAINGRGSQDSPGTQELAGRSAASGADPVAR